MQPKDRRKTPMDDKELIADLRAQIARDSWLIDWLSAEWTRRLAEQDAARTELARVRRLLDRCTHKLHQRRRPCPQS
jgi:hypothetical protein